MAKKKKRIYKVTAEALERMQEEEYKHIEQKWGKLLLPNDKTKNP